MGTFGSKISKFSRFYSETCPRIRDQKSTSTFPFWAPRKKSFCASFPEKERKKGTHINFFGGILGVKKGAPNGPFSATKKFSLLFFSCPYRRHPPYGRFSCFVFCSSSVSLSFPLLDSSYLPLPLDMLTP